ncbi:hypothetical protein V5799_020063 [Amblyomma americanum]|uniref:Uncharacterized protein n=1 Tax=Amblyomma americanum TaxID=6943 RepID=A0AAQ4EV46_AMBAM
MAAPSRLWVFVLFDDSNDDCRLRRLSDYASAVWTSLIQVRSTTTEQFTPVDFLLRAEQKEVVNKVP